MTPGRSRILGAKALLASSKPLDDGVDVPLAPHELQGWVDFNVRRTGLEVRRFSTNPDSGNLDGLGLRAVFYLDRRGRIKLPPSNAYVSVVFNGPHGSAGGRTAAWLAAAGSLVEEMKRLGVANQLYLPPDIVDVRPWIWGGFFVSVRYTYYVDFPYDQTQLGRSAKNDSRAAAKAGLTVRRVTDVQPVLDCLAATEVRQRFSPHLNASELGELQEGLGDGLRMYVCFDRDNQPVSASLWLHSSGARAIGWVAGNKPAGMQYGAAMAALRYAMDDLSEAGASGMDLGGANLQSIGHFKSHVGGRLVPNYGVRTYSPRTAVRFASDWLSSRKAPAGTSRARTASGAGPRL